MGVGVTNRRSMDDHCSPVDLSRSFDDTLLVPAFVHEFQQKGVFVHCAAYTLRGSVSAVFIFLLGVNFLLGDGGGYPVLRAQECKAKRNFVCFALCNFLASALCIRFASVWMSISASDAFGKFCAIFLPISAFVAMGLDHSVANM